MELTKTEMDLVKDADAKAIDAEVRDLNDLQLALIGGGVGEVTFS